MSRDRGREIKAVGKSTSFDDIAPPELSILLPTYNRPDALHRTLRALEKQTVNMGRCEVIVVDDGSTDSTARVLDQFVEQTCLSCFYALLKENGGPARARNIGLTECRGQAILILGDDIEPSLDLVEKHLQFHQLNPEPECALLGFVSFPKELSVNPFMEWLETDGRKYFFNYVALKAGQTVDPLFFYTCNVSVKASLLQKSGWFDESFPYASHEDLELGYRLADKGMRLVYDPSAKGYHWHILTINGIARRTYLMGHSANIFWQKVGDTGSVPRRVVRRMLSRLCSLSIMVHLWDRLREKEYSETKSYPGQWQVLLFLGFFIGLSDSYRNRKIRV